MLNSIIISQGIKWIYFFVKSMIIKFCFHDFGVANNIQKICILSRDHNVDELEAKT